MTIVKYKNQSGVTYAYEQTSVYDPEKKQSRPKRKYLGRVDPETGEIISTEGKKGRPPKAKESNVSSVDDGQNYRALYEATAEKLEKSKSEAETLRMENEKLIARNRQLSDLLLLLQEKIRDTLSRS